MRRDGGPRVPDQRRAVEALAVHPGDPIRRDRLAQRHDLRRHLRRKLRDLVARRDHRRPPLRVADIMRAPRPGRGHRPGIGVDHRAQVVGQAVIDVPVHRPEEIEVVERLVARDVRMAVGQLVELERRGLLPGDDAAVEHALGQRLREGGHGHPHRVRAHPAQQFRRHPRRPAQVPALKVRHFARRGPLHVDQPRPVHMRGDQVDVGEIVHQVRLRIVPRGQRRRLRRLGRHERQFQRLRLREPARLVAGDDPAAIDRAVGDQVVHRRGRAAELHERVDLHLDPPARLLLDGIGPGLHEMRRVGGGRVHEMLEAERDLLRRDGGGKGQRDQGGADDNHGRFPQMVVVLPLT